MTARVSLCFVTLAGLLLVAYHRASQDENPSARRRQKAILNIFFFGLFSASLLIWRLPWLRYDGELNPDESQMLAQVMRYQQNPIPWRSVDGTTSGPLNTYVLMWPLLAGMRPTYQTARLTGLFCLFLTVLFSAKAFARIAGCRLSLLGVLPMIACYLFACSQDLVHYSSEHVPVCLLAGSVWLLTEVCKEPTRRRLFVLGILLGAVPFSKLQAGPLAGYLFGVACFAVILGRGRTRTVETLNARKQTACRLGALIAGGLLIPAIILLPVCSAGAFDEFLVRYIESGALYRDENRLPFFTLLGRLLGTDSVYTYLVAMTAGCGCTLGLVLPSTKGVSRGWQIGLAFAIGYLLISVAVVMWSGFPFSHYALFLVTPPTYIAAWLSHAAGQASEQRDTQSRPRWTAALRPFNAPACCILIQIAGLAVLDRQYSHFLCWAYTPEPESLVVKLIAQHAEPGGSMAVWGWTPAYYVRTKLTPATRDTVGHFLLMRTTRSDRYRADFLNDMKESKPRIFVDSSDEFHWRQWGRADQSRFTMYAPLAEFVKDNYRLVASVRTDPSRLPVLIYVRNENSGVFSRGGKGI